MNWKTHMFVAGLVGACATGCGSEAAPDADDAEDTPVDATSDALRFRVFVPRAKRAHTVPFTVSLEGTGVGTVGAFKMDSPAGTVKINGEDFVTVARSVANLDPYVIYQTQAVGSHGMYHVWYYCYQSRLLYTWRMGTDGADGAIENATGTCTPSNTTPSSGEVRLPWINFEFPAPIANLELRGRDIWYDGEHPGFLAGEILLPFNYRSQSTGSFVEALTYSPFAPRVRMVQLELRTIDGVQSVRVRRTLGFNDLSAGAGQDFPATWSTP